MIYSQAAKSKVYQISKILPATPRATAPSSPVLTTFPSPSPTFFATLPTAEAPTTAASTTPAPSNTRFSCSGYSEASMADLAVTAVDTAALSSSVGSPGLR